MPSTLKPELLHRYAGKRKLFCETGTAAGEGVQTAIEHGFGHIYSVEANAEIHTKACQRFAKNPNVDLFLGDGGQVLRDILRWIKDPAVFWLDSHWSTGEAPLPEGCSPCPLLAELRAIAEHPIKDHVILIDDIRYFWQGIAQWKNIHVGQIVYMVLQANPLYSIRFEEGVSPLDILVAVPPSEPCIHEAVEVTRG